MSYVCRTPGNPIDQRLPVFLCLVPGVVGCEVSHIFFCVFQIIVVPLHEVITTYRL